VHKTCLLSVRFVHKTRILSVCFVHKTCILSVCFVHKTCTVSMLSAQNETDQGHSRLPTGSVPCSWQPAVCASPEPPRLMTGSSSTIWSYHDGDFVWSGKNVTDVSEEPGISIFSVIHLRLKCWLDGLLGCYRRFGRICYIHLQRNSRNIQMLIWWSSRTLPTFRKNLLYLDSV
jgi:hypothetical protein